MTIVDGTTAYKVWWDHQVAPTITKCFIRVAPSAATHEEWDRAPVYEGIARLSHRDTYCKNRGRKVSLRYALNALGRRGGPSRQVFWQAYFAQLGHW